MSSLSLTVATKETASPMDITSPFVGDARVNVGGVPMATRVMALQTPPTSSSTLRVMV